MYKEQLDKAFQLIKDGEKGQAGIIVKGVLREDPRNVDAWWLTAHVFDDEDKVVKSLEKVLEIDPNHSGARRRLASLRPEYSHFAPQSAQVKNAAKNSETNADAYWDKLQKPAQPVKKGGFMRWLANGFVLRLLIAGIVVIGFSTYTLVDNFGSETTLYDQEGRTPQNAVEEYFRADYMQDVDAVYAATCPELHDYVDGAVAEYPEYYPAFSVDFSRTRFVLDHHSWWSGRAYVRMEGELSFDDELGTWSFDWVEDAVENGYDHYGQFTHKVDGVWLVCVEYDVPNLTYNRD